MTRFLQDILRQPDELMKTLALLNGPERNSLESASDAIRKARHVYLTGIGASWNAALGAGLIFLAGGLPVHMLDASELLQFATIPPHTVIVVLSRSGRSVEIVKLLAKARSAAATVIGVTNFKEGTLAHEADIPVVLPVQLDNGISVNTYTTLAIGAAAVATASVGSFTAQLVESLSGAVAKTAKLIPDWQEQFADSNWLQPGASYYFLARGSSLASAHETALLWEEGVKAPAAAMGTGTFRHGPQEAMRKGVHVAIWIDNQQMRERDLAIARDLIRMGCAVLLIGQNLPEDAGHMVIQIPPFPAHWQFITDIVPMQLAANRLAQLSGEDCDSFRFASYIVEDEDGLVLNGAELSSPTSPELD
jgi:glucosamine--fructose-6-phosphate aminotransferase (isomerizing)